MKFVLDRIEEGIAVVIRDDGEKFNLPAGFLPEIREGGSFEIVITDSSEKKEQLKNRLNNLFERGKNND